MAVYSDPMQGQEVRERFGAGIFNNRYMARAFVAGQTEEQPITFGSSVSERLQESLREQLGEQRQHDERTRQMENIHNSIRGNRSNHLYFSNDSVFQDAESDQLFTMHSPFGDSDGDLFDGYFQRQDRPSIPSRELEEALDQAAMNTAMEFGLERRNMMFLLSIEGYEMLGGGRPIREFMGIEVNVSYDQIDLYKVIVKGVRGYDIARRRARKLQ